MIVILFGVFVYCGPPTGIIDFLKSRGSIYWDRAKQIIGGNDANNSRNLGQYDRVGFAAVPDQYEPDDFYDEDEYANGADKSKEKLTPKKTPPDNKKSQEGEASKDLLADDDGEEERLEL